MKPQFLAASTKLENGFTLIEASAGTGKTTTICAIVLRLIAEREIPIERILVTTYTELATAELRGRIREILFRALSGVRGQPIESDVVRTVVANAADNKQLARRLEIALQNFDEAPIFTIHGFCARVLADRAFESGTLFDTQLTTDQSALLREIAEDFWRKHFHQDDAPVAALLRGRLSVGNLVELLQETTNNPVIRIVPAPKDLAMLKREISEAFRASADAAQLEELSKQLVVALQTDFCAWARQELRGRKADRQLQSYDDMLTRLNDALRGKNGSALRQTLRARFAVALIDEFQDTDPVQYSIFRQIYEGSDATVFFIGDPKQAIYGFRGADVFTYLEVARQVARTYTLEKNWRSEAKLVEGVSEIFRARDDAFVLAGIDLPPVAAAGRGDAAPFRTGGERDQPLRVWIASPEQHVEIEAAVAEEIARLLTSDTRIGEEKIEPRHIAVLVNNNMQPLELQRALLQKKIPSVVYSAASIFQSREAEELLRALRAVAEPTRDAVLRAALATELLGYSAAALENFNDSDWEATLNRFADYHLIWRDRGFVEMIRAWLLREGVRGRLLCLRDGERRLTNVLHLIDSLHAACAEFRFGIDGLIAWFAPRTLPEAALREEDELRLESDEDAVRIVTIHKSKGLEYGVTFLPFGRKEPWSRGEFLKFHHNGELVLDLEERAEHKQLHNREQLAESVRQLYVGLTRAEHRSYVIWQERKTRGSASKSRSALAWLMADEPSADTFLARGETTTAAKIAAKYSGRDDVLIEPLPVQRAPNFEPAQANSTEWTAREFRGEIDRTWGISSFSAFANGRTREPESPDYDSTETLLETEPLAAAEGIHAFPGGTRAGTCLHKILEELDFVDLSQLPSLAAEKLGQFHIGGFDEIITETIARVLQNPLGSSGILLAETRGRLPELEFTFPLSLITAARLQETLALGDLPGAIGRLLFQPTRGFLKGFIDLVFESDGKFYFLDWKSNWLGPDASFYSAPDLGRAMTENFYTLQLSIYSVALHRYLRGRIKDYDYDRHFGGAFYVFLRGLDNVTGGVFQMRPGFAFIEALDRLFHGNA